MPVVRPRWQRCGQKGARRRVVRRLSRLVQIVPYEKALGLLVAGSDYSRGTGGGDGGGTEGDSSGQRPASQQACTKDSTAAVKTLAPMPSLLLERKLKVIWPLRGLDVVW